jgi:hypothetical protein
MKRKYLVGLVACMGKRFTGLCWGIVREIDHLQDPRLEEWIILKRIFRKWNRVLYWIEFVQSRAGGETRE